MGCGGFVVGSVAAVVVEGVHSHDVDGVSLHVHQADEDVVDVGCVTEDVLSDHGVSDHVHQVCAVVVDDGFFVVLEGFSVHVHHGVVVLDEECSCTRRYKQLFGSVTRKNKPTETLGSESESQNLTWPFVWNSNLSLFL